MLVPFAAVVIFVLLKIFAKSRYVVMLLFALCIGETSLGIYNVGSIKKGFDEYAANISKSRYGISEDDIQPFYHLTKDGQNVIVLYVDRGISSLVPFIVRQFPELAEKFSGFTFYPNCVSFAVSTNIASPAVMGGYEYTPDAINERDDVLLVEKHNEASLLLPHIFLDAGYDVTVTDPPWPNYTWKGDLSAFEKYPEIHVAELQGKLTEKFKDLKLKREITEGKSKSSDEVVYERMNLFVLCELMLPKYRAKFYTKYLDSDAVKINGDGFYNVFAPLYFMPELTRFDN